MSGSVNKVILIGNTCADPEIRNMQSGDKVCSFSIATSERWKDKKSGERQERTQFTKVVVFNQNIIGVMERYVTKGSKVYIEGQLETRQWEKDGVKHYATEVVLRPFKGELTMLSGKDDGGAGESTQRAARSTQPAKRAEPVMDDFEDSIPF